MTKAQHTGTWKVAAASVQGSGRERTGIPCQDSHFWTYVPRERILAITVADGAGSAPLAEIGSDLAARTALRSLVEGASVNPNSWRQNLRRSLKSALSAVEAEAAVREVPPRDLATTLIVVLATESGVAAAQIGDGAVVVGDNSGDLTALTIPSSGEYINETTFLISPGAIDQAQVSSWDGTPNRIAVFSDGLQRLALKAPESLPHAPFFRPLFDFAAASTDADSARAKLGEFLRSPRVASRADDDLTLVLAVYWE